MAWALEWAALLASHDIDTLNLSYEQLSGRARLKRKSARQKPWRAQAKSRELANTAPPRAQQEGMSSELAASEILTWLAFPVLLYFVSKLHRVL